MAEDFEKVEELDHCPQCGGELVKEGEEAKCHNCGLCVSCY